jgi:hypothetical protein
MDDIKQWTAEEHEELSRLEEDFLASVSDEEMRAAYSAARQGDVHAVRMLAGIATGDSQGDAAPRREQADTALDIIQWFRMATFEESRPQPF